MKKLGITQRVESIVGYGERRDCLDQRWGELSFKLNYLPIPLPNISNLMVPELLDTLCLDAIVLSSGNTIAEYDSKASDVAPERDAFEAALIDAAILRSIPILGVCRGMQMINVHFGGYLSRIEGHVGCHHPVVVDVEYRDFISNSVNSFHKWGITRDQLSPSLTSIVHDQDNNIEAFVHNEKSIAGIMWHPERESIIRERDVNLLKKFLL